MEQLLNVAQVSQILGVGDKSVRQRTSRKWKGRRLNFVRVGQRLMFRAEDVEKYFLAQRNADHFNSK